MPFPEAERIIYRNNPLQEVVCQMRFPPILMIDMEPPARLQELIRHDFPSFQEKHEAILNLPAEIREQMPVEMLNMLPSQRNQKNYEFISEDENWKINLTRTFIALTSRQYIRWEEFIERFTPAFNACVEIYSPAFFTRVGLRYKDVINRSNLGLDNPWSELLQPPIAGILTDPQISNHVKGVTDRAIIGLSDQESVVRIEHGLVNIQGQDDPCYMIDSDFFTERRTRIEQAMEKLNYFHQRGTRLLRWCITDNLHNALGPEEIDD